tara:strand:+ start:4781 stop:5407 length:627 start_codon:yes stop_codon:yes gene_type:complete
MVFEKAWRFLKASRQTELGEFHPDFPSSYGPMTAISSQPTQRAFDSWRERWNQGYDDFNESMAQPYEAFVHEGMKAKPPSDDALEWENPFKYHDHEERDGVKSFDLRGKKGHWFAPASNYHNFVDGAAMMENRNVRDMAFNHPSDRVVGIRMPLDTSMGQFRDKGYSGEGPEAFIEGDIPPERLVMVPRMLTHRRGKPWPGGLGRVDE